MGIQQAFLLALKSLMSSKMRSFLTMLGIIIGIAAVIALVSMMSGVSNQMMSSFESMGTNNISVVVTGRGSNRTITPDQLQEFAEENSDVIAGMSPSVSIGNATIKHGNKNITTTVSGVSEYYDKIRNLEVASGRYITYLDVKDRLRNCVIGTYVVNELFEGQNPLGQTIKINGTTFTVAGILKETAESERGSADDTVMIPYTVAQKISFARVSSYTFAAVSKDTVTAAKSKIEEFLYKAFSSDTAYTVVAMAEALEMVNDVMGTLSTVLVGIAGISLLVGGIGIMNIMLVSVTERTREIGIRKALGATPWDILSQFVVEAITTSAVGGVAGIMVGVGSAYGLSKAFGLPFAISVKAVVVAFSVSAAIGIAFGYFPAKKAAAMNPIDALRYE